MNNKVITKIVKVGYGCGVVLATVGHIVLSPITGTVKEVKMSVESCIEAFKLMPIFDTIDDTEVVIEENEERA